MAVAIVEAKLEHHLRGKEVIPIVECWRQLEERRWEKHLGWHWETPRLALERAKEWALGGGVRTTRRGAGTALGEALGLALGGTRTNSAS
jgi:hypothetical protein